MLFKITFLLSCIIFTLTNCQPLYQNQNVLSQLQHTNVKVISSAIHLRQLDKQLENQLQNLFASTTTKENATYFLKISLQQKKISVDVRDPRTADRFQVELTATYYLYNQQNQLILQGLIHHSGNYEETMNQYQNYHVEIEVNQDQIEPLAQKIYETLLIQLQQ